jgi:rhomboid protease GluP
MALNVAMFVVMAAYGFFVYGTINGTEDMGVLALFGAKVNQLILDGEYWRLFTAMFIHIGPFHLLLNLVALNALGPLVEGYFGHWRFLAIYVVAGLAGSLASYAFSPIPSAGASGAIFGLAGASVVYFYFFRENFGTRGRALLQNILFVIGLNLVLGFVVSGIDYYGHIGGLVGGALAAYGLLPRYRAPLVTMAGEQVLEEQARHVAYALWVLLLIGLLAAALIYANGLQAGMR